MSDGSVTLFLCGDVMTGRGIDQVLPTPSDPRLVERYVRDAREYVDLAVRANGPIPRPVDLAYPWGIALAVFERVAPDARIVNLETSVTVASEPWPKGINYRMRPENVGCLTAAKLDCCVLANNHVIDWGFEGLEETVSTLRKSGLLTAGAGADAIEAAAPATIGLPNGRHVLVSGYGSPTSGIPEAWAAGPGRAGVNVVAELSAAAARSAAARIAGAREERDLVVASVHWGPNWGYAIAPEQREFAHALIDAGGADVVHGHSSHHAKGIEVYRGKPIIYGCGDFLNDYEGIAGYEHYRGDLSLAYFPTLDTATGMLLDFRIVPMRMRRFALHDASRQDAEWLAAMLTREGRALETSAELEGGDIALRW
jgi:poly-gamma-glutamate capsule biosynthesis protein CapA/YwtB (metallophosphatase superfamily)